MVFSHSWQKKSKKRRLDEESFIYPVLSARELLKHKKFQSMFKRLKTHVDLEDNVFDEIYTSLIENFSEFVQSFPYRRKPELYHFNVALTRACHLVEKIHHFLEKVKNEYSLYKQQRILFAVFSGALLNEIGAIDRDRLITITEQNGYFLSNWYPLAHGAMRPGSFYRLRFARHRSDRFAYDQCAILASKLMPGAGMAWVSEDSDLFSAWMRSLHQFEDGFSDFIFGHDIKELWAEVIDQDDFKVELAQGEEAKELEQGEAFWQFIRENMEKGAFKANEDGGHVFGLEEGCVFDLDKVFYDFQKTYPQYRDWVVVQRQFNHLGIAPLSGQDLRYQQYFKVEGQDQPKSASNLSMYRRQSQNNQKHMLKNTVTMSNIYMFVNPSAAVPPSNMVKAIPKPGLFSRLMGALLKSMVLKKGAEFLMKGGK